MKTTQLLTMFKRLSRHPLQLTLESPLLLKRIKQQPDLSPLDLFSIYNICSPHPKTSPILQYIEPSLSSNWVTLFKRISVMLLIESTPNVKLIEEFMEYLEGNQLTNSQIVMLSRLLTGFEKGKMLGEMVELRKRVGEVVEEGMGRLSGWEVKMVVKGLAGGLEGRGGEPVALSRRVSMAIERECIKHLDTFTWTELNTLELLQDRTFFNRSSLHLFKLIKSYKTFSSLTRTPPTNPQISTFLSSITPSLRLQSQRQILQQQSVSHSSQRLHYYTRISLNPLYSPPSLPLFQSITHSFSQFSKLLHLIEFQDYDNMIPILAKDYYKLMEHQDFINVCYLNLKSDRFINLEKYPEYVEVFDEVMEKGKGLDNVHLNKLMHVLVSLVCVYPQHKRWLTALDDMYQQELTNQPKESSRYNLSLLKLIGVTKSICSAMPKTSSFLHSHFQYSLNKRQLMFFQKLQYLTGRTPILPENTFSFPETNKARSIYEQKICKLFQQVEGLSVQQGVYYKGYEIDLLVVERGTGKKVYVDVCGSKHFYKNERVMKMNTVSKMEFLKGLIGYEVVVPGEEEEGHTNWKQVAGIVKRWFGVEMKEWKREGKGDGEEKKVVKFKRREDNEQKKVEEKKQKQDKSDEQN